MTAQAAEGVVIDAKREFLLFLKTFRDRQGVLKYRERIKEMVSLKKTSVTVDLNDLYMYNPKLVSLLVRNPEPVLEAASEALREIVRQEDPIFADAVDRFFVRVKHMQTARLRELRSEYVGRLVMVEGILVRATPVKEKLVKSVLRHVGEEGEHEFTWPLEGEMHEEFELPAECPVCGGRPPFRLVPEKSVYADWQKVVIQEKPEEVPPGQLPRSIEVILTRDLVDLARPGDRVSVTGVLKVRPVGPLKRGTGKPPIFDMYIDAVHIDVSQKLLEEVMITKEDEEKIKNLAKDPWIRKRIIASIAPGIHGHWDIKEAIALSLFGGVPKQLEDGTRIRGDIHVLIIGDPGTAKSLTYSEPILYIDHDGKLRSEPIGSLVDRFMERYREHVRMEGDTEILELRLLNVQLWAPSINPHTLKLELKQVKALIRHSAPETVVVVKTRGGRRIVVTKDHSLVALIGGKLVPLKPYEALSLGVPIPVLKQLPAPSVIPVQTFVAPPRDAGLKAPGSVAVLMQGRMRKTGNAATLDMEGYVEWDLVETVEESPIVKVEPEKRVHVYDISVEGNENFVAGTGHVFVHNSQLLQFAARIAPRGIYTSGKGSSAAGLCVLPDTYIVLGDGTITTIKEVVDKVLGNRRGAAEHGVKVLSLNTGCLSLYYGDVEKAWKLSAGSVVKIETSSGVEIGLTPENPVLTIRNGRISWRRASELRPGDYVARIKAYQISGSGARNPDPLDLASLPDNVRVKLKDSVAAGILRALKERYGTLRNAARRLGVSEAYLYSFNKHAHRYGKLKNILEAVGRTLKAADIDYVERRNGSRHRIPGFTADFGYLVGYMLGGGTVDLNKGCIRISTKDGEAAQYLAILMERLFGRKPVIARDRRGGATSITFNSAVLARIFHALGVRKPKARAFIHPLLTSLDEGFLSMLVAGLMDSKGSYITRGAKSRARAGIVFTTASKDVAYKLHMLLLRMGIFSRIRAEKPGAAEPGNHGIRGRYVEYVLTIADQESVKRYVQRISSPLEKNKGVLKEVAKAAREKLLDAVPSVLVKDVLLKHLTRREAENAVINRSVSRTWLSKVLDRIPEGAEREYLEKLVETPILWDRVKSITIEPGPHVVYDLTVRGQHNFVANSLIVHNTAAVLRDKTTGEYYLEAGALVLADGGVACLHPETRVLVNDEYVRIDELFREDASFRALSRGEPVELSPVKCNVVGVRLDGLAAEKATATIVRKKMWRGELVRLTFKSGAELVATPDHLLLDADTLEWREAGSFKAGDRVLSLQRIPGHSRDVYILDLVPDGWTAIVEGSDADRLVEMAREQYGSLSNLRRAGWKIYRSHGKLYINVGLLRRILGEAGLYNEWRAKNTIRYSRKRQADALSIPRVTPELGYILGFLHGDGYIVLNERRGAVNIVQPSKHRQTIGRLAELIGKVAGRAPRIYVRKTGSTIGGRHVPAESVVISLNSVLLAYIANYFLGDDLRRLLKLPDEALKAFLAGLIDSGGSISVKSARLNGRPHKVVQADIVLESRDQAGAVSLILRRFDIYSRVKRRGKAWLIQVTGGEDVARLLEAVKPYSIRASGVSIPGRVKNVSPGKNRVPRILSKTLASQLINYAKPSNLSRLGAWSIFYEASKGRRALTKEWLKNLVSRIDAGTLPTDARQLLEVAISEDYYVDEIVKIERIGYEGPVYDLYVPGIHNFLANGIVVHNCIDEFDKMRSEDRSAIHEALEQQSYHRDFEILLADGRKVRIGELVDQLIEKNRDRVIRGRDTEVLPVSGLRVMAYDLRRRRTVVAEAVSVSRHKAPRRFVRITFSNGRTVMVTPEHPIVVWRDGGFRIVRADMLQAGTLVPGVREYLLERRNDMFPRLAKECGIDDPGTLARLVGFLLSDGFVRGNPGNGCYEIGFSNPKIAEEFKEALRSVKLRCSEQVQESSAGGERPLYTVRVSRKLYNSLAKYLPELMLREPEGDEMPPRHRRLPALIFEMPEKARKAFLNAFFEGNGFVDNYGVGFTTPSSQLAEDLQDLLLTLGINSYVSEETGVSGRTYYKVIITGADDVGKLAEIVADDEKYSRVPRLVDASSRRGNNHDVVPYGFASNPGTLLNGLGMNDGQASTRVAKRHDMRKEGARWYLEEARLRLRRLEDAAGRGDINAARRLVEIPGLSGEPGTRCSALKYGLLAKQGPGLASLVLSKAKRRVDLLKQLASGVEQYVDGNIRFLRVENVEIVENTDSEWVYDITVEPYNLFVSHGVVLHNSVSIAKAGIVARLNARTTVIAAGNPKYGRWLGTNIAENIELPPTILSRFDLIFILKDEPHPELDRRLARHVLRVHREAEYMRPEIPVELLKKYVSYARRNVYPRMTGRAAEIIEKFFVELRKQGLVEGRGGRMVVVPVTARQLEALVRLAEAHARMALKPEVAEEDALEAIRLMMVMMQSVGYDTETGMIDSDIISVGMPRSRQEKLYRLSELIRTMVEESGEDCVKLADLKERAETLGIKADELQRLLRMLRGKGEIYERRFECYAPV